MGATDPGGGRPIIRPFSRSEIHSNGPVLSFAETDDSTFFIGSNHLLLFNGLHWQRIDIAGAYAFRALAAARVPGARDRVWIGAIGAVGYAECDRLGTWSFVSLQRQLNDAGLNEPGEIWFVSPAGRGAIFVSTQHVFRWDGVRFEHWALPAGTRLKASSDSSGNVWIYQDGVGLLRLAANGPPELARPAATLPAGIEWMIGPSENGIGTGSGMLVGTADGAYRLTAAGWKKLPALSEALAGQSAMEAVPVDAEQIAIGTLKNGAVLATRDGDVVGGVSHANGLSDDVVYSIWADRRGAVWLGQDNGCQRVDRGRVGFVSVFDARDGLEQGLPREVLSHEGANYVLTDKAFYRIKPRLDGPARLTALIASHPLLSDVLETPGGLWVSGADGLWRFGSDGRPDVTLTVAGVARLTTAPWLADGFLYCTGNSLWALVHAASGRWVPRDLGIKINSIPLSFLTDERGNVWLSTASDGVYEFAPGRESQNGPVLTLSARYREGRGLPAAALHPVLFRVGSRLLVFTETQILKFDPSRGFIPAAEFAGWVGVAATAGAPADVLPAGESPAAYIAAQRSEFIGSDAGAYAILRLNPTRSASDPLVWEALRIAGVDSIGEITSVDVSDSEAGPVGWIGGKGGLLRFLVKKAAVSATSRPTELREVRIDVKGGVLLDTHPSRPVEIPPPAHRIEFSFSAAQPMEPTPVAVTYQTRLRGVEADWSSPDKKTSRDFTGLAPGNYVFMVRRVDRFGRTGLPVSYPFIIIAPWYLRWPAIAGYVLALAAGVAAILRWRLRILQRQTERLDRLVAQRTRELELSNTAKSEFLENISHEIRNPLNGIVGLANLLKTDRLSLEDREVAQSLKTSAENLRRVSEDVLGFSKLEFGYGTVESGLFSLGRTLGEVVAMHDESARRQGNSLTLTLPPGGAGQFFGDEAKIRTIVGNFISNALKYAPGTPVEVRADWTDDGDSAQVFISVADHGPGVPANEQELIFQKFVRGSNASKGGVVGSGIGLASCRTLARRMGGTVGVESPAPEGRTPGALPGATFYLWLPLGRPAPAAAPAEGGAPPSEVLALIVDDEDYNRLVLAGLAKELGYRPLLAGDADSALEIARSQPLDVVFLDLDLPGIKGDETARLLRKLPGGEKPILIATTGHDSAEARRRCKKAGMDGFLLKPFDVAQVRDLIARVRRPSSAPAPAADEAAPSSRRTFELYAKGATESADEAVHRFFTALDEEISAVRRAGMRSQRGAMAAAGHRLRTLGALVRADRLCEAAIRMQDDALTMSEGELAEAVADLEREAKRLKSDLEAVPSASR